MAREKQGGKSAAKRSSRRGVVRAGKVTAATNGSKKKNNAKAVARGKAKTNGG
ncbi:MAG: hypothetical protein HOF33_04090, partial [Rhodospirillaceae bacterium]|nr:hypothetical protein [Rhodospirillaceae bacterium]